MQLCFVPAKSPTFLSTFLEEHKLQLVIQERYLVVPGQKRYRAIISPYDTTSEYLTPDFTHTGTGTIFQARKDSDTVIGAVALLMEEMNQCESIRVGVIDYKTPHHVFCIPECVCELSHRLHVGGK